jgi:hypothetical protein
MTCSTATVIGILVRCSLTAVSSSSSFIMDSPAVVRAQGHSPARDSARQASRNRSAARSVPTSRNRPRPQAPAPCPGHRHSPKYRTGTHPWIRGRNPARSHRWLPTLIQRTTSASRLPGTWTGPQVLLKGRPDFGSGPGTALCRGVLPVLARPMRSQAEVHAWTAANWGPTYRFASW